MKASWIIVSYNTKDVTLDCLKSLQDHETNIDQEVIVVDNDSKDGSPDAIAEKHPWVHLIRSGGNLGFAKGSNLGMAASTGDLVILLNPDTVVHPGALRHLVDFLSENESVGIVGGRLLSSEGKTQWSQRYFPSITRLLCETLYLHYLLPRFSWTGELDKNLDHYRQVSYPDWISGAFLGIRRELYDKIGELDERYFMYYEDVDWCFECRKEGWSIAFLPEARVTHYGGLSSSQDMGTFYPRLIQSQIQFNRKHFSKGKAAVMRAIICLNVLQRTWLLLLISPIRMLMGKKKPGLLESR
ncbi:MAG: glycosyltransferase family 2 protein, partial [Candidatus Omnitrophica bacterium]|nr:glycosyltransferase family 2 protein [Candidatus Omnitrophota bacterium]